MRGASTLKCSRCGKKVAALFSYKGGATTQQQLTLFRLSSSTDSLCRVQTLTPASANNYPAPILFSAPEPPPPPSLHPSLALQLAMDVILMNTSWSGCLLSFKLILLVCNVPVLAAHQALALFTNCHRRTGRGASGNLHQLEGEEKCRLTFRGGWLVRWKL